LNSFEQNGKNIRLLTWGFFKRGANMALGTAKMITNGKEGQKRRKKDKKCKK